MCTRYFTVNKELVDVHKQLYEYDFDVQKSWCMAYGNHLSYSNCKDRILTTKHKKNVALKEKN